MYLFDKFRSLAPGTRNFRYPGVLTFIDNQGFLVVVPKNFLINRSKKYLRQTCLLDFRFFLPLFTNNSCGFLYGL